MYLIHQYDERGYCNVVEQAVTDSEAVALCARLEDEWEASGKDRFGACYIIRHGSVVGDRDGIRQRDNSPPYDASGCVMTGREF